MPTNIDIDLLRTPRGLKWAIPVALVATPAYLFTLSVCATIVERGGPGYLDVLVLLFACYAAPRVMPMVGSLGLLQHRLVGIRRAGRPRQRELHLAP